MPGEGARYGARGSRSQRSGVRRPPRAGAVGVQGASPSIKQGGRRLRAHDTRGGAGGGGQGPGVGGAAPDVLFVGGDKRWCGDRGAGAAGGAGVDSARAVRLKTDPCFPRRSQPAPRSGGGGASRWAIERSSDLHEPTARREEGEGARRRDAAGRARRGTFGPSRAAPLVSFLLLPPPPRAAPAPAPLLAEALTSLATSPNLRLRGFLPEDALSLALWALRSASRGRRVRVARGPGLPLRGGGLSRVPLLALGALRPDAPRLGDCFLSGREEGDRAGEGGDRARLAGPRLGSGFRLLRSFPRARGGRSAETAAGELKGTRPSSAADPIRRT